MTLIDKAEALALFAADENVPTQLVRDAIAALPARGVKVYECAGCGRLCRDPEADLAALRAKGAISCCPERRMEPIRAALEPAPAAQAREAAARLRAYLERRKRAHGFDQETVHTFDAGTDHEVTLTVADLEAMLRSMEWRE